MDLDIKAALDKVFAADNNLYQARCFQRCPGWGKEPALINIDLVNAWTREEKTFAYEGLDTGLVSQKLRSLEGIISHQGGRLTHYGLNPGMITVGVVVATAADAHADLSRICQ
jgi:hypothetical protein